MQKLLNWLKERDWFATVPNMITARREVQKETGEDIPVYFVKLDKLYIFTDQKPDIKNPGLITLTNVYVPDSMLDEVVINRDSIEYITELK